MAKPTPKNVKAPVKSATTAVRNTAIPKATGSKAAAPIITHEMIARRAFEISQSSECRSETENWCRAERELRGGR